MDGDDYSLSPRRSERHASRPLTVAEAARTLSRGSDRWIYAAPLLALLHLGLILLLQRRPGLPAVVLWHVGPAVLTIAAVLVMGFALLRSSRARHTWTARRTAGFVTLAAIGAMPLAYRTYPSSRDDRPSAVRFRLPLDGPVTVRWGGPTPAVNYHVIAPAERWAYDLFITREGRSFRGRGAALDEYFAFGARVVAPAAGRVRLVTDGRADAPAGAARDWLNACGNHVVIEVAAGEFLFLCHLQNGSIQVTPGERVVAGQPLGRIGNSGRSSQPHLHVHLQTTADSAMGEGIPMFFHGYRSGERFVERGMPTGGRRGELIEHVGTPEATAPPDS